VGLCYKKEDKKTYILGGVIAMGDGLYKSKGKALFQKVPIEFFLYRKKNY